ncbi:zinc-binding dehydrogenase [Acetobacter sp. TBRC 12305]|uniref:Zinc-binding dehydrogenase n=1 Tax=Acetobacter garciniae TaxID=2817435 RepID=A0A939KQP0_9PROT|nr:zinc-binding dehydrogenase [Acetobacter garciniae]MBO1325689.1 zinc-binding dehydrogenase [Acetobacter garciniae]MBX0345589.1 zinc-binding dehydrogenase [Acetobacter garciniae]
MKALVLHEHGGMEKLHLERDFPDPTPGEGEVVLRVRATSLNYHDIFTRRGMPGIKLPMPCIMGLDVAGELVAIGDGVTGWAVGDRVLVDPINRVEGGLMGETQHGGMAELCRAKAHQLIRLPENISFEQAAALPVAYGTALRMMYTIGQVKAGEKVLILGASGGVGICCVQLAKLAGCHVIACAGTPEKGERLRALGADEIILYTETDIVKAVQERHGKAARMRGVAGGGVDVVVNFTGGDTWKKSLRTLRLGGRQLTCGATAGFAVEDDLRYIWTFELQIRGSNAWEREDIDTLLALVGSGKLKAVIDRTYTLDEGIQALAQLEDRKVIGKVVVTP